MPDPVEDATTRVVGAEHAGQRLDKALAALLGESRARVQRLIDAGLVQHDQAAVGSDHYMMTADYRLN